MRRTLISLLLVLPACFGDEITGSARRQPPDPLPVRSVTIEGPTSIVRYSLIQFTATVVDMANQRIPAPQLEWSTSDPNIAIVNQTGVVQGVSEGLVTISATIDGKKGEGTIRVLPCIPGWYDC